ncbi:hypothetical protein FO519_008855 [Halicephalobus sp. NKZ332]|nr:hypothetical protein FO519_008855 [Halicephalobus sp. NKZ332]
MPTSMLLSFFLVIFLVTVVLSESRIICTQQEGGQQRSICRPRFAALKNNEYRSMLQAIADRQVNFLGSLAFRRPQDQVQKSNSPPFSYQDIMHNLLMKNTS